MDLPVHTLSAQLNAAYLALETMGRAEAAERERAQLAVAEALRFRDAYEALMESFATLTAQVEQSQQAIARSEAQRQAVDRLIEEILASRSWRLTKPLRWAARLAQQVIPLA